MDVLTAQDATRWWLSRRTPADLFMLYCFDDTGCLHDTVADADLRAAVCARAARIPELRLRVRDRRFAYPAWEDRRPDDRQVTVHTLPEPRWTDMREAVAELLSTHLDAERSIWRLHIFRGIRDAPGGTGPALVTVLQLSHAAADGRRAATIARRLFTALAEGDVRQDDRPAEPNTSRLRFRAETMAAEAISLLRFPIQMVRTIVRGLAAARAETALRRLTESGEIAAAGPNFAPTGLNRESVPTRHAVRMIVGRRPRVPGFTVTVVTLTAISVALGRYLTAHGEPVRQLGAQVSIALPEAHSRNNYRDISLDLLTTEPDLRVRAERLATALSERRARALHPLQDVRARVAESLPASLLRRDLAAIALDEVPDRISGHTVVSSVDRGPADLSVAGGRVRFTAGFPAIGTVMHLTHAVHGLGDSLTLSIHADPQVMPDVDSYEQLLREALAEVVSVLTDNS
ncbi:MAG: DUF1298 domain-containing protein [Nocardia sp.]|nr:DUF1298 domain-containing protein [Nocardia sp.]